MNGFWIAGFIISFFVLGIYIGIDNSPFCFEGGNSSGTREVYNTNGTLLEVINFSYPLTFCNFEQIQHDINVLEGEQDG